ncbi:MAG: helix-turn-helix transcriptional regulator [Planctomycetes bacterium]|nr:helix-turn-helix transcriptional regulator [Planctomycetota bacterium]
MAAKLKRRTARQLFADNMREIRRSLGLSQEALASLSKLHRTYIGSVERGERNISIDNMEAIAHALDCTIPDLLSNRS